MRRKSFSSSRTLADGVTVSSSDGSGAAKASDVSAFNSVAKHFSKAVELETVVRFQLTRLTPTIPVFRRDPSLVRAFAS